MLKKIAKIRALKQNCSDSGMVNAGHATQKREMAHDLILRQHERSVACLEGLMMAILGVVDFVSPWEIRGWAFHEESPEEHLAIEVALASTPVGQAIADISREDLAPAGFGAGDHAFRVVIEAPITADAWSRLVVVAVSETGGAAELAMDPGITPLAADARAGIALFAENAALFPPVGFPADFIDEPAIGAHLDLTGEDASQVVAAMRRDTWPIPHPDNRENYAGESHLLYWLSGYGDFRRLGAFAALYGVHGGEVLDFGGSTGRVFRHFAQQSQDWRVWSCDFKRSSFAFSLAHFPPSLTVFLNTSVPSLPIPDGAFDLVVACSVFTHIDDAESAWLLELRRVLKLGGVALISIHNGETWRRMVPSLRETVERFRPGLAAAPDLPGDRVVVPIRFDGDPYNCNVFHSDAYVRRNWGRYYEIAAIEPLILGEQALVVCRRTD
jgi:SAM-dependent methyltransferase